MANRMRLCLFIRSHNLRCCIARWRACHPAVASSSRTTLHRGLDTYINKDNPCGKSLSISFETTFSIARYIAAEITPSLRLQESPCRRKYSKT